jgi:WhiB family redox-sensing transcriptional regulator
LKLTDEWRDRAACRSQDPSIFFNPETTELALAHCNVCVSQAECLTDALSYGEKGIRGGMTEQDREQRTLPDRVGSVKVVVDYALFLDDI